MINGDLPNGGHLANGNLANGHTEFEGVSLEDLPKSHVYTSKLPPDPSLPDPETSLATPLHKLGPRTVFSGLYSFVRPSPTLSPLSPPRLLAVSTPALRTLGLHASTPSNPKFLELVSGSATPTAKLHPWAHRYGGYQFGSWASQLGDGRALTLFECTAPHTSIRYELALKGAGLTPYSRFADGKAVLRSSIREFVVSEYLNSIRIPTTRALSLVALPAQTALRENGPEPCAVVARFAESWVRIGTFDLLRRRGEHETLRKLADYVYEEVLHLPAGLEGEEKYTALYHDVVKRNARTTALWQVYGFMNGVLNTDNTSILGLSLDFGPFAFMDVFDPAYTPNHDDHAGRYSYRTQPTVIWWNMVRLGEDLAGLFALPAGREPEGLAKEELEEFVARAEKVIVGTGEIYKGEFVRAYEEAMAKRLGLREGNKEFFEETMTLLEDVGLDMSRFFVAAGEGWLDTLVHEAEFEEKRGEVEGWVVKWKKMLEEQEVDEEEKVERMRQANPKFVPRGWVLEEVINRVAKGDEAVLEEVMACVASPFAPPDTPDSARWCGPVPAEKSAMMCSCSS